MGVTSNIFDIIPILHDINFIGPSGIWILVRLDELINNILKGCFKMLLFIHH